MFHPSIKKFIRRSLRRTVPGLATYRNALAGKRGLELGGPSEIFGDVGILPVYACLSHLDNCLYSAQTLWTGKVESEDGFKYHDKKGKGTQFICDASDLHPIPSSQYDFILASHCLEHIANPLRALAEWKRVLKPGGYLLLILPHKDETFDWRRPTTELAHMTADYESGIGEDDLTHLPEILKLHDLKRDRAAGTREQFHERCRANATKRAMHHHVFATPTAVALVDAASFQILQVQPRKPFHIIILAQAGEAVRDNSAFLASNAAYLGKSPFRSDRYRRENRT